MLRSKGYFLFGSRPEFVGQWNQAGGIARYGFAGMFWQAIPKSQWPDDEESLAFIHANWVEPFGDIVIVKAPRIGVLSVNSCFRGCVVLVVLRVLVKVLWMVGVNEIGGADVVERLR